MSGVNILVITENWYYYLKQLKQTIGNDDSDNCQK